MRRGDAGHARNADHTILVIDIGGTAVKFGYAVAGRPHAYSRLFPTAALRDADPIAGLTAMIGAVVAPSSSMTC